jgi:hypothetical protein
VATIFKQNASIQKGGKPMEFLKKLAKKWQDAEAPSLTEWSGVQSFLGWISQNVDDNKFGDYDIPDWLIVKEIATSLLRNTMSTGGGGYDCEFGPVMYSKLVKIITNGEKDFCARHGHIPHRTFRTFCICCGKRIDAKEIIDG